MAALYPFLEFISRLFGWIYTFCWSLSFYPQIILNFQRRSTTGTTIDFPAVNTVGFLAYFIYNATFLYSPRIRNEYALRNHGLTPTTRFNDLAFAAHALVLSILTVSQFIPSLWGFERRNRRDIGVRISRGMMGVIAGSFIAVGVAAIAVLVRNDPDPVVGWAWIDVIYTISYVKLFITLVKFIPQLLTNYRNRSTQGWSVAQVLLDFIGSILSITQLGIDSYLQHDWSGITGNPVKLLLGNASIFYDVILMAQHYYLYKGRQLKAFAEEEDPLLRNPDRESE